MAAVLVVPVEGSKRGRHAVVLGGAAGAVFDPGVHDHAGGIGFSGLKGPGFFFGQCLQGGLNVGAPVFAAL